VEINAYLGPARSVPPERRLRGAAVGAVSTPYEVVCNIQQLVFSPTHMNRLKIIRIGSRKEDMAI